MWPCGRERNRWVYVSSLNSCLAHVLITVLTMTGLFLFVSVYLSVLVSYLNRNFRKKRTGQIIHTC